jgi:hypothetical protein
LSIVVSVNHQPRHRVGIRIVVKIVHARDTGNVSQHGVVRAGHPAQQIEDGQRNGHQHAVEHAEQQNRSRGGQREEKLATPESR